MLEGWLDGRSDLVELVHTINELLKFTMLLMHEILTEKFRREVSFV
jgi:hypothetical protein